MRQTITATLASRRKPPMAVDRIEVFDTVIPGFGLRIGRGGARSWFLMTRIASGDQVRITFGRVAGVGLVAARALARKALELVAHGKDPRRVAPRPRRDLGRAAARADQNRSARRGEPQ